MTPNIHSLEKDAIWLLGFRAKIQLKAQAQHITCSTNSIPMPLWLQ